MTGIKKGDEVEWTWGTGKAEGTVAEKFTHKVTKTIKGKSITRDATAEEPVFLVKQEKGKRALKSDSELHKKR